jgi:apolipoprotein N-acyltransferase
MAMTTDRWILVAILASFLLVGLIEVHMPHAGQFYSEAGTAHMFVLAVLLFMWCRADAERRGIKPPTAAPLLVAAVSLIGVPYYFFRTLPWRKAMLACLKALGFILIGAFIELGANYASRAIAI